MPKLPFAAVLADLPDPRRDTANKLHHLPAYSPDLNPIKRLFSKLKAWLRRAKARTGDALIDAMGECLASIRFPG